MRNLAPSLALAGLMIVGMTIPFAAAAAEEGAVPPKEEPPAAAPATPEGAPANTSAPAPAPASPHTFSTTVNFLSDYVYRGLSRLTWGKPAFQGSFDYTHASGFYAGIFASNISANVYPNVQLEIDYYGGYNGKVNDDLSYTVGVYTITLPGANYNKTLPIGSVTADKQFGWTELNAGLTYKWFGLKYWYAVNDYVGYSSTTTPIGAFAGDPSAGVRSGGTKGSGYLEANANFDLGWDLALGLHVGHQRVKNGTNMDYTDYKAGVVKQLGSGWNVGLAYTATSGAEYYKNYPSAAGQGTTKDLNKSQVIFSVGRVF